MEEDNNTPLRDSSVDRKTRLNRLYWIIPLVLFSTFIILVLAMILLNIYSVPLKHLSYEYKCHGQPIVAVEEVDSLPDYNVPRTYYKPLDKVPYDKYSNFVSFVDAFSVFPSTRIEFFCTEAQAIDANYTNSKYESYEAKRPRCQGCKEALDKLTYTPYVTDYDFGHSGKGTFKYTEIPDYHRSGKTVLSTLYLDKNTSPPYLEEMDGKSEAVCAFITNKISLVGNQECTHYATDKNGREILIYYDKDKNKYYFGIEVNEVLIKLSTFENYSDTEIVNIFNSLRPATKEELNRLSLEELV